MTLLLCIALSFSCVCQHMGLATSMCSGDTITGTTWYDICSYTQARIDCGLMTCTEALANYDACPNIVCECSAGCTFQMLYGGGTTYCNPNCDNAACKYCLSSSSTSYLSDCPSIANDVQQCLIALGAITTTSQTCEYAQGYIDCYAPYDCLASKNAAMCTQAKHAFPNCTLELVFQFIGNFTLCDIDSIKSFFVIDNSNFFNI